MYKYIKILWLLCLFLASPLLSQIEDGSDFVNHYPIILVHGFGGWGPDEVKGYKYWGGSALDIEKYLRDRGFVVYTASVGPISSNHDRACELFYQIKGGRLDYGEGHASHYKHNRFGKSYAGFYPQWNRNMPVHVIGHSMGGQTCRMLGELLARDFFGVGSDALWLKSVTTISTPNNGTTLATVINKFSSGCAEEIVASFLALVGTDWEVYNFDMDQWNLHPNSGESLRDFLKRLDATIGNTKDISLYDLLPKGSQEFNQIVHSFSNVYYFSYATEETYVLDSDSGCECPRPTMNPLFWVHAYMMGHYRGNDALPAHDWWKNDGVVNTISMSGPSNATILRYNGRSLPGVWNYMGVTAEKDHGKIIGHYQGAWFSGKWLPKFYYDMAAMLYRLP
jgi:triacylglycerol lipase